MVDLVNIEDMRRRARRRLPRMVFDYLEGGAGSERGLRRNRDALDDILFDPHRLVAVDHRDQSAQLFGKTYAMPLAIAPTGLNGVLWPDGDRALARAAAKYDIPFCLSTASTSTIEDVARATDAEKWFQLYVMNRDQARDFVQRALKAGYSTLILTTDVAVNGKRERDLRSGFKVPFKLSPKILFDTATHPLWSLAQVRHGLPQLANFASADATDVASQSALMARRMDAGFDWEAFAALRDLWPHKLIVKGVLCVEDALRLEKAGADAVVFSNHGGRQLEDVPAPISLLQDALAALQIPILMDSGIRSGADIAKAVASGAVITMSGRALLYGLAAAGEAGVCEVLDLMKAELDTTLALVGCPRADLLSPRHLATEARAAHPQK
ncbi:alpha-hydroxy-acid oxidizing protein [Roseinatronobacter alkalisoli]|uniref:Alpha-hydroxy-acid oxidizing protein n=1 Tax=Roseinatronobacter alkalisoli TaxID=3028235 RepID=A0ABT5TCW3_9RHOB|nr:alpha-hydroxy-acid oxidizing protein [Roseinatronobacter sp. HJB301]MDD7972967.1 alpha-hydroxy-acid oxidizing protein [Roseinatronobacter sp. HJB301]